jgi:hypothetical protein
MPTMVARAISRQLLNRSFNGLLLANSDSLICTSNFLRENQKALIGGRIDKNSPRNGCQFFANVCQFAMRNEIYFPDNIGSLIVKFQAAPGFAIYPSPQSR